MSAMTDLKFLIDALQFALPALVDCATPMGQKKTLECDRFRLIFAMISSSKQGAISFLIYAK